MTGDGQDERDPQKHGRRETDAIGVEFDKFTAEIKDQLSRWIRRGLIAFGIIGITVFISLFGVYFVLHEVDDVRAAYVRSACEASNNRNKNTSKQLIALAAVDENHAKTPEAKAEVRNRRDVTLALIDALSPKEDCDYLVDLALGDATPTPAPTPPRPKLSPTATATP